MVALCSSLLQYLDFTTAKWTSTGTSADRAACLEHELQRYPGLFETPRNLKLPILDDFRPRITMGNPIVTEILGFSDVGFSKTEKILAKKSKK